MLKQQAGEEAIPGDSEKQRDALRAVLSKAATNDSAAVGALQKNSNTRPDENHTQQISLLREAIAREKHQLEFGYPSRD